ncbi:MAG: hypothetical protein CMJ52_03790 [Planctomycetaceae bacterium]|nr:hypothetical protein [Planctomycetaceae bacterium]
MDSQHADHEDAQSEEARVNASVDPLISAEFESPVPEGSRISDRQAAREDRFLAALVSELDRESATVFDDEVATAATPETTPDHPANRIIMPSSRADASPRDSSVGSTATESKPVADLPTLFELANAGLEEDDATTKTPADAVVEIDATRIVDGDATRSPASETGIVVEDPFGGVTNTADPDRERSPSWARLWWLARLASEQARVFSNQPRPTDPAAVVAGVNERE